MIKKNGNCILQFHRGVSSDYPENTMVAYHGAVELGYEYGTFKPDSLLQELKL